MSGLLHLLSYLRKYKRGILLNIFCNIMMAIFMVVSIPVFIPFLEIIFEEQQTIPEPEGGFTLANALDYFRFQASELLAGLPPRQALLIICSVLVGLFFLKNLFRYLSMFFIAPVRNGVVRDLRNRLFGAILTLPLGYFTEKRKGDIIARTSSDVTEVEFSILNVLEAFFREPLVILGSIVFMLYVSPSLTLFVFLLIIFTGVIIGGVSRSLKKRSALAQTRLGQVISILEESLSGLRIIKGFGAEEYQDKKFRQENDTYKYILDRILWRRDLASPLSEFLGICVVAVLLWYGSGLVFTDRIDAGTFFAFLYAFYNVINPAKTFSNAYYHLQKGLAALDRVEEVLKAGNPIQNLPDATPFWEFEEKIEYRNVTFSYTDDKKVLRCIQLEIPRGRSLAIVGASGAGKSTLVDLLPRFYDVQEGAIHIDGIDIRNYRIEDLRAKMGIVSQEPILFNDTVRNNIVFGRPGIPEEQVIRAATIANAHEFIMEMENGYDTSVGDQGSRLSGGQRQRITIARAILENPPILILDEATSSLDSEAEKQVQKALRKVLEGRTSLVIAHRLSTIQEADEIIVMKEGEIIERGDHDSLLKKKGEYQKFVTLQIL